MTLEEKARAYDKALEIAKAWCKIDNSYLSNDDLETLFPELKESKDERIRNQIINFIEEYGNPIHCEWQKDWIAWLEKQGEQKPAETVELKCEESKTKVFDAPAPFEDKLYAFVAACEFLAIPSKIEFILEHSQEILDAAREQIGKEQSSTWSKEDEEMRLTVLQDLQNIKESYPNVNVEPEFDWLKSLKTRCTWKPSDEQIGVIESVINNRPCKRKHVNSLYNDLKKLREDKL